MSWPGAGPTGPEVLADPAALVAGDRCRLLPAAATAGAQVRAVAEQLAGARFDRPRSLIVVDPGHTGSGALLGALLPRTRVPVVAAADLPGWAGPLDLAVVLASTPDDWRASLVAAEAARRGGGVLVRAADRGPVAEAAGPALLAPRVAAPELLAGPGRLALLLAVAWAADVAAMPSGPGGSLAWLASLAAALDAEALACGPTAEPFVNPALALAQRLVDAPALFLAEDPIGLALAAGAARSVRLLGGRPAGAEHAAALLPGGQLTAALQRAPDPFADPDVDGPGERGMLPVLIPPPTSAADPRVDGSLIARLARTVPRAVLLTPDEPDGEGARAAATLALRIDFAAVYLGIAAGQIPPADGQDGLGPSGGIRDVRPASTVEDVTSGDRDEHPWN